MRREHQRGHFTEPNGGDTKVKGGLRFTQDGKFYDDAREGTKRWGLFHQRSHKGEGGEGLQKKGLLTMPGGGTHGTLVQGGDANKSNIRRVRPAAAHLKGKKRDVVDLWREKQRHSVSREEKKPES